MLVAARVMSIGWEYDGIRGEISGTSKWKTGMENSAPTDGGCRWDHESRRRRTQPGNKEKEKYKGTVTTLTPIRGVCLWLGLKVRVYFRG